MTESMQEEPTTDVAAAQPPVSKTDKNSTKPCVKDADIEKAAALMVEGKVVAFTGAGISAESGVPTYRDPGGLWRHYKMKKVSHLGGFKNDPISCWRFELELYRLLLTVHPNDGHRALAKLEADDVVVGVVTQNVEGLHASAGSRTVIELHGNETQAICLRCRQTVPVKEVFQTLGWLSADNEIIEEALPDITPIMRKTGDSDGSSSSSSSDSDTPSKKRSKTSSSSSDSSSDDEVRFAKLAKEEWTKARDGVPSCPSCHDGLLKPDAIYFGEGLVPSTLERAVKLFAKSRVALVVGSTCKVVPASALPVALKERGGHIIDINPVGSRLSPIADVWLKGHAADVLPRLARAVAAKRASVLGVASGSGIQL